MLCGESACTAKGVPVAIDTWTLDGDYVRIGDKVGLLK